MQVGNRSDCVHGLRLDRTSSRTGRIDCQDLQHGRLIDILCNETGLTALRGILSGEVKSPFSGISEIAKIHPTDLGRQIARPSLRMS